MDNKEMIKEKVNKAIGILEIICEVLLDNNVIPSKNCTVNSLISSLEINPQYGQISIDSCFVIEEYYYIPDRIYTPIGYIKIPGRVYSVKEQNIKNIYDTLENRINLQLFKRAEKTTVGLIGGWYKIGDSEPIFKKREEYINYLDSYAIFERCIKRYI